MQWSRALTVVANWPYAAAVLLRTLVIAGYAFSAWGWPWVPQQGVWFFYAGTDGYPQLAASLLAGNGLAAYPGGPWLWHRAPLQALLLVPAAAWPGAWPLIWAAMATALQLVAMRMAAVALPKGYTKPAVLWALALHPFWAAAVRSPTPLVLGGLLLLAVALALQARRGVWAGGVAMAAGLAHPALAWAPVLVIGAASLAGHWRLAARAAIGAGLLWAGYAACMTAVAPWPQPWPTGLGLQYWLGHGLAYQPVADTLARLAEATGVQPLVLHHGLLDPSQDRLLAAWALHHALAHPLSYAGQLATAWWRVWTLGLAGWAGTAAALLMAPIWLGPLALMARCWQRLALAERWALLGLLLLPAPFAAVGAVGSYGLMGLPLGVWLLARRISVR